MMTRFFLLAGVAMTLMAVVPGVAAQTLLELADSACKNLQTLYDAKKEATKKAEDARTKDPTATTTSQWQNSHQEEFTVQNSLRELQSARASLESGNEEMALMQLGQVQSGGSDLPAESRAAISAIIQRISKDRTAQTGDYSKTLDTACERAAAAVLQAKEPKDLDASLKELQRVSGLPAPGRYGDANNAATRLRNAVAFVTHWQDYLAARNRHDERSVRNLLQNMMQGGGAPLIPRSEILARIPQTESDQEAAIRARHVESGRTVVQIDADAFAIVRDTKKLVEVPGALAKLADLRTEESQASRIYRSDSVLNASLEGMESLQRSILEYQNGLSPEIGRLLSRTEYPSHPEISLMLWALRLQLVKEVAPHLIGGSSDMKPGDDEPVGVFLNRLVEAAKTRQDWAAVIYGMQILRMLSLPDGNPYGYSHEQDISTYQTLLSASNMEKANQYQEAVSLYLTALRSGQQGMPATWIGEHLATIKQSHPDEYALGTGHALDSSRAAHREKPSADQRAEGHPDSTPLPSTPPATTTPAP